MKLIEALVIVAQEYGIYGDWKATHSSDGFISRVQGGMYFANVIEERDGVFYQTLLSQSDRLETVIADYAQNAPDAILDEQWKVSRWEEIAHSDIVPLQQIPTHIYHWQNGMVMCFDQYGQQIPEYQGTYEEAIKAIPQEYHHLIERRRNLSSL